MRAVHGTAPIVATWKADRAIQGRDRGLVASTVLVTAPSLDITGSMTPKTPLSTLFPL